MKCANCGAENPAEQKFCNECAAPFKRRCAKCGYENAPTAKFCGEGAAPQGVTEGSGRSPAAAVPTSAIRVEADPAETPALVGQRKTATALCACIKGSKDIDQ